jgi:hypothetical protein
MAKKSLLAMGVVFLMVLITVSAWADVPEVINYQGKLTDSGGNALDGTYSMTFYLYDAETGGSSLWNETQSVNVLAGIYNVKLGAINPLDVSLFTNEHIYSLYLEVVVGGETLSPRQRLTSTAFSMKAGDADTLEGLGSSEFAGTSHDHSFGEITGTATDAQIPNNITINYATTSGNAASADSADFATNAANADMVDGHHASDFAQGSEIMPTVLANDGAGSGLDADYLDGNNSSSFAAAGHNHDGTYYTKAYVDALEDRIEALEAKLQYLTVVAGTVNGMPGPHVMVTGANLHVRSGSGATDGTKNGTGNLIVGYNEARGSGDDRTGSHNIVVGREHNYSYYGGLVAGYHNTVEGGYSCVSGGFNNWASGSHSSVSGGYSNHAVGDDSSISGGSSNSAMNTGSSVSGGYDNNAFGVQSSISGGNYNKTDGYCASVSGGNDNTASGGHSSISGGAHNTASGPDASISGGSSNTASGLKASVSGGYNNTASGTFSSVSGGQYNKAFGLASFIGGGGHPSNPDYGNTAHANYSAILGGTYNHTGAENQPTVGELSTVSGGDTNRATGGASTVSGGVSNQASGWRSAVSGGNSNAASGTNSTVSGGYDRSADLLDDWRGGSYFSDW